MTDLRQDPIFIVGYPRSGTTLLQALLATQGDLVTFPETHFFSTLREIADNYQDTLDGISAQELFRRIAGKSGGSVLSSGVIASVAKTTITGALSVRALFESYVVEMAGNDISPDSRWLEKTPDHGLCMENILHYYPKAMFVGILRNPLKAIYSRTKHFPPKAKDALSYLAKQWVDHVLAFEIFQNRYPGKALLFKYEDLCEKPYDTMDEICCFIKIEFISVLLEQYQQKAERIILPFENWKRDVKESSFLARDDNVKDLFSTSETLKIKSIVFDRMIKYGYQPQYPLLQGVYNLFK
jgi:hypothetical protein